MEPRIGELKVEHHYFFPGAEKKIDLAKMEAEAHDRCFDKRSPESSILHFHPHGEACEGSKHKYFRQGDGLVLTYDATSYGLYMKGGKDGT